MTTDVEKFSLVPKNMEEAMEFATMLSDSTLVPKSYKGKPGDIVIAIQMGQEVGLSPMQSLQNIASVNGNPTIWGDAPLALARGHRQFEWIKETFVGNKVDDMVATCVIKRKNNPEHTTTFSWADAVRAGLAGRDTYKKNPRRMLQMRARGFCVRDTFGDAIKGLSIRELQDEVIYQDEIVHGAAADLPPPAIEAKGVDALTEQMNRAQRLQDKQDAEPVKATRLQMSDTPPALPGKPVDTVLEGTTETVTDGSAQILSSSFAHHECSHPPYSIEWWMHQFAQAETVAELKPMGVEIASRDPSDTLEMAKAAYIERLKILQPEKKS